MYYTIAYIKNRILKNKVLRNKLLKNRLFRIAAFILFSLFFCSSINISAQNVESKKDRVKQIENDIRVLDEQITKTQQARKNTLNGLVLIRKKVAQRQKLIRILDEQVEKQGVDIEQKTDSIKILDKRLSTLEEYYKKLIMNAYKNRDSRKWFMYVLASNSIEQGYRRWIYLKNYSKAINEQGKKLIELKATLDRQKENLISLQNDTKATQEQRQKEYDIFKQEEKKSNSYAISLERKQNELKRELSKKKREVATLNKEIEKMVANAVKQDQPKKNTAQYTENIKLSGEFSANKGKLPWPIDNGVITEQFGIHNHPILKGVKLPFNNGVNITAPKNSRVKAVFSGVVRQIILIPGYNQCVLVRHGNYLTFYCKLNEVSVRVGDKIPLGGTIGYIDDTVLHFELWNGSTKQDPELWLR